MGRHSKKQSSLRNFIPKENDSIMIVSGEKKLTSWVSKKAQRVYNVVPKLSDTSIASENRNLITDNLITFEKTTKLNIGFDKIIIDTGLYLKSIKSETQKAARMLSNLVKEGGCIIFLDSTFITHGEINQEKDHIFRELNKKGFQQRQILGRGGQVIFIFILPGDGTGSLNKIRHITINDTKSSTYKLALIRSLARISELHPASGVYLDKGKVGISLGLIAFYWIKLYKRLISLNIKQSSSKHLSFVNNESWQHFSLLTADDLTIGSKFEGNDAVQIIDLLLAVISTIKSGPIKHIYSGSHQNKTFTIERISKKKWPNAIVLDKNFFHNFDLMVLDDDMWKCFRNYACWIEPLVIQEWINEMKRYSENIKNKITIEQYYRGLEWIDPDRDTDRVRKRLNAIRVSGDKVPCTWTGNYFNEYEIDHCLPFCYIPNNDLWNLFPASSKINKSKSSMIPSEKRMFEAMPRIINWWTVAWDNDEFRNLFFIEASMALPLVEDKISNFEDVFMSLNNKIKSCQQRLLIPIW